MEDSAGGNCPRTKITTRRLTHAVTCSQVVDESAAQPRTEKSWLAHRFTEQPLPTSSPEHGTTEHTASLSVSTINSVAATTTAVLQSTSTMPTGKSSSTPAGISYFSSQLYLVLRLLRLPVTHRCLQKASTTHCSSAEQRSPSITSMSLSNHSCSTRTQDQHSRTVSKYSNEKQELER